MPGASACPLLILKVHLSYSLSPMDHDLSNERSRPCSEQCFSLRLLTAKFLLLYLHLLCCIAPNAFEAFVLSSLLKLISLELTPICLIIQGQVILRMFNQVFWSVPVCQGSIPIQTEVWVLFSNHELKHHDDKDECCDAKLICCISLRTMSSLIPQSALAFMKNRSHCSLTLVKILKFPCRILVRF